MKENFTEESKSIGVEEANEVHKDLSYSILKNGVDEKNKCNSYQTDLGKNISKNSNINLAINYINKNEDLNKEEKVGKNEKMHLQDIPNDNFFPKIIQKYVIITHKDEIVSYAYTLVSYKNYNLYFITHDGKFASWVYSYNVILPFNVEQETEIILGERNYPFLEIFCSKFMKDHAPLLKYQPIIFALSIFKMCFDDKEILTQIFENLSNLIK